tara:strand:- start:761 stop:952 length:192 start_codon:yes stop_codon:yes gene_type:complete
MHPANATPVSGAYMIHRGIEKGTFTNLLKVGYELPKIFVSLFLSPFSDAVLVNFYQVILSLIR